MGYNFVEYLFKIIVLIFGVFLVIKHKIIGKNALLFWQARDFSYFQKCEIIASIFCLLMGIFLLYSYFKMQQKNLLIASLIFLLVGILLLIFNRPLANKFIAEFKKKNENYFQILCLISGILAIIWVVVEFLKNLFKQIIGR